MDHAPFLRPRNPVPRATGRWREPGQPELRRPAALRLQCAGGRVQYTRRVCAGHGDQVRVGDRVAHRSDLGVAAGADGARTIADPSRKATFQLRRYQEPA
jgi:hypothetical protein